MKIVAYILTLLLLLPSHADAKESGSFDMQYLAQLPVLHDGRVKPLSSVARHYALILYGDSTPGDSNSATEWLIDLLFKPENAKHQPVFEVRDRAVRDALALPEASDDRYNFVTMRETIRTQLSAIIALEQRDPTTLSPLHKGLLEHYNKTLDYAQLLHTFFLLDAIDANSLASLHKLQIEAPTSRIGLFKLQPVIEGRIGAVLAQESDLNEMSEDGKAVTALGLRLRQWEEEARRNYLLRLIFVDLAVDEEHWHSPSQVMFGGIGTPATAKQIEHWRMLMRYYQQGEHSKFFDASKALYQDVASLASGHIDTPRMALEQVYHKLQLWDVSLVLYGLGLLLLLLLHYTAFSALHYAPHMFCVAGFLTHVSAIALRSIILIRPPVGTLYESILFVAAIVVAVGLWIEWRKQNGLGLSGALLSGCVLLLLSQAYRQDGDTLTVLMAVLNTNFWLATHVLTITIGYGLCIMTALLAHVYLFRQIRSSHSKKRMRELYSLTYSVALFALLFTVVGTILGGIWADQSWGRFWGWDPKENGAMLIALWLIWVLHGRISKHMKDLHVMLALAYLNVIIALAWFGVNLLGVGLHSYGFTDGALIGLAGFVGVQTLLVLGLWAKASTFGSSSPPG